MLFSNTGQVIFAATTIKRVHSSIFLGIFMDEDLSWKPHINNVCNIASRYVGLINKLKRCFPLSTLKSSYYVIMYSYLNYGILAWSKNASKTFTDKMLLLQKKAMIIICNIHYLANLLYTNNVLGINEEFFIIRIATYFKLNLCQYNKHFHK